MKRPRRAVPKPRTLSSARPKSRLGADAPRFIVVTGMSGAGKSHALRTLEDVGYFCVDNLPVALIPAFAALVLGGHRDIKRAAVVVDVREGRELSTFPLVHSKLMRQYGKGVKLVFLEANDATILRRFSETRRPHPLGVIQPVADGIAHERLLLQPLRRLAGQVVDTSSLTVHDLRRVIVHSASGSANVAPLLVNIISFGFRRGTPPEADLVFDVRFLPNPHFVESLRKFSGQTPRVSRYVLRSPAAKKFLSLTIRLLQFLVPQYISEGKTYLTIGIGCTGGRHRSVAIAETLARRLRKIKGVEVHVRHRDVGHT